MMIDAAPDDENHANGMFPHSGYEAPKPFGIKDDFLPWHRPRKQYVRHHQWCHEVNKMIAEKPLSDGVLKYFGLPGVDLLDLRHFHAEVCQAQNVKLRFLGFNSSARPNSRAQTELNISLDEVMRLPQVDSQSYVMGDNFAQVSNQKSLAFNKACELGPYDVINLDLCDGFGAQAPGAPSNSYYDAVSTLMALQARTKNPWLLMLTTRADKPNINDDVLELLITKYLENLTQCSPFREASQEHFAIENEASLNAAALTSKGLLAVFLTGLCKWFIGLSLDNKPPTSVELLSAFGYRVEKGAEHEDLISLALKFTPTFHPANDRLGLAVAAAPIAPKLDEGTMATKALRRIAKRIDADKKLAGDEALCQRMVDATAHLLGLARYDVNAYMAWIKEG